MYTLWVWLNSVSGVFLFVSFFQILFDNSAPIIVFIIVFKNQLLVGVVLHTFSPSERLLG